MLKSIEQIVFRPKGRPPHIKYEQTIKQDWFSPIDCSSHYWIFPKNIHLLRLES